VEVGVGLQGIWWNEIGCKMEIEMDTADPKAFQGVYHLNFGSALEKSYPLLGRCDNRGLASKVLAFVVVWDADPPAIPDAVNPSVTAWCGRLQVIDGEEVIATTWIQDRLRAPGDDWESTLVGVAYFKRVRPSPAEVDAARKYGRASRAFRPM
jgi:hypothetical protein